MIGNEGRTEVIAVRRTSDSEEWGKGRRLLAALLVAFSMVGMAGVVFAGTTSAQTSSDAVLQWLPQIQAASAATGIGPEYIAAVIRVESGGDPNAVSSAGAIGLMQVMPAEFQGQGIPESAWFDPATNIMAGSTEIASHLASTGSIEGALSRYFGIGCDSTGTCTDGYISTVLSYASAYASAIANGTTVDTISVTTDSGTADTGTSATGDTGTVDTGVTGDGAWQGGEPPAPVDGGQGGVPADQPHGGGAPHGDPGNGDWTGDEQAPTGDQPIDDTGANG